MLGRLPEEIQVNVFLRLPVKSIRSCRRVCKPFCKLLYNPKFIKDHLLLDQNKKDPSLVLITRLRDDRQGYPFWRSIDSASILSAASSSSSSSTITVTCNGAIRLKDYTFGRHWDNFHDIQVVGSCRGLVCICIRILPCSCFCIWNPSTGGEYKILSCSFRVFSSKESKLDVRYGFGYDSQIEDYKLVKICNRWEDGINMSYSQIEVYTFGSKSYKTIQCMHRYVVLLPVFYSSVRFLNGALHWPGYVDETSSRVIVSFDLSSETFVDFLYPQGVFNGTYDHVGLLEGCLCLVVGSMSHDKLMDVWLMQDYGVTESWIKRFSFRYSFSINTLFFKLAWSSTTNGEFLLETGWAKILYDPKKNSTRVLEVRGLSPKAWSQPVSYVESLESLNLNNPTNFDCLVKWNTNRVPVPPWRNHMMSLAVEERNRKPVSFVERLLNSSPTSDTNQVTKKQRQE